MFLNGNICNLSPFSPVESKVETTVDERMKATKLS